MSLDTLSSSNQPQLPEVTLSTNRAVNEYGLLEYLVKIQEGWGFLEATFEPASDIFDIGWLQTSLPRHGLGKLLLQSALDLAVEANAELLTATIVKRQCLDAASRVFGPDAISVEVLGSYDRRDTRAYLNYYLPGAGEV
jgi:hypothetical protein